ncbi:MAG: hypothetical protein ABR497_03310 [Kiritimatiellia bacterium]
MIFFLHLRRRPPPPAEPEPVYSPAAISLPPAVSAPPPPSGARQPVVRDVTDDVGAPIIVTPSPSIEDDYEEGEDGEAGEYGEDDEDGEDIEDSDDIPQPAPRPSVATDSTAVSHPLPSPATIQPPAVDDDKQDVAEDDGDNDVMLVFKKTRDRYLEICQGIEQDHLKRIKEARESFVSSLATLESTMQERGALMGVLAVRKEKEEFQKLSETAAAISNTASDYPEITALKNEFNKKLEALRQERDEENILRSRQYDARLASFERQLTQSGRIEQALLVHQEREGLRKSGGSP